MNFSFAGCGFLGIYHVGVASCLRQHAPHLIQNCQFAGASAGAIVACCLICDCCLGDCTTFTLRLATKARSFSLGPLHPSFKITKILREALREVLPDNAHEIASGKLHISLTRVSDRENVVVSQYDSKEELIQALMCSAHVPLYSGLVPPVFQGVRYVDGGLSDNIPAINEQTVSISPFAGESDICPSDNSAIPLHIFLANTSMQCTMENMYRLSRALFPPHPAILSDMCQQGFDDTLKYLQDNNLLSCVRHLSIRSVIKPVEIIDDDECPSTSHESARSEDSHESPHVHEHQNTDGEEICQECKKKRQVALLDKLPHAVGSVFQEAIDEMNKGMKGYIYRHRSLRLLSVLVTPWYLPIDISLTYAIRFLEYLPHLPRDVQLMYQETTDLLRYLVTNIRHHRRRYTARFTCQLAITEVNYNQIDTDICPVPSTSHQISSQHLQLPPNFRNLNFEFAVDLDSDVGKQGNKYVSLDNIPHQIDAMRLMCRQRSDSASGRLNTGSPRMKRKLKEPATGHTEMFDTFEQCLHVSNQMESIMAYHYQDEDNKDCFRFEEIYSFRDGEIDLESLVNQSMGSRVSEQQITSLSALNEEPDFLPESPTRGRSHSVGHELQPQGHLECDLEEFVGHRSEIVQHEKEIMEADS